MKAFAIIQLFISLSILLLVKSDFDDMCHMYYLEAIDTSNLVFVASTTEGPFPATLQDYNDNQDLTAWGKAGSSGVSSDRDSVVKGVPITLNFNVYNVDPNNNVTPMNNAHFYIWHCDAAGVYSAVSSQGTSGQKWLRGVQPIVNGKVSFKTIIPGWYTGRILHYHIRIHLDTDSSNKYAMTSQVFISNDFKTKVLDSQSLYTQSKQTLINLSQDNVYNSVSSSLRDKLFLKIDGNINDGFSSTFNMGISSVTSTNNTTTMMSIYLPYKLELVLLTFLYIFFY